MAKSETIYFGKNILRLDSPNVLKNTQNVKDNILIVEKIQYKKKTKLTFHTKNNIPLILTNNQINHLLNFIQNSK